MAYARILLHGVFWMAIVVFCAVAYHRGTGSYAPALVNAVGFLPGHIIFAYSIIYFLIPRFIFRRRVVSAVVWSTIILAAALSYLKIADIYLLHYSGRMSLFDPGGVPGSVLALLSTGGLAVSIKLVKTWYHEKEIQGHLERDKLKAELNLLKAQLQPHFLFNTLNNIYSLTLENSSQASPAVLKLSSLLRYILYECDERESSLSKEIRVLKDYIELEQMRYGERIDIVFNFTGDIADKLIAPLLLLPFIENSFKHGIGEKLERSWIMLDCHVEENRLVFKLTNSSNPSADDRERSSRDDQEEASGLGMQQVKKRLDLLYPDRHSLTIIPDEDTYTVSLVLQLNRETKLVYVNH